MASGDKDVAVNKIILSDDQLNGNTNQNQIPDAGDQSSNFPKEEFFKQNIQMGEASLFMQDEALQHADSQTNEKINASKNTDSASQPRDNNSESTYETSLSDQEFNGSNVSSKSNSNSTTENNSVLFSNAQNPEQSDSSIKSDAYQSSNLNSSEESENFSASNVPGGASDFENDVDNEASAPELNVEQAKGDEDSAITLDISASLTDVDGSESLVIQIQDIPEGAILSDGVNSFVANSTESSVNVSEWNFDSLTITPVSNSDSDFDLKISATSTEQSNNDMTSTEATLSVSVNGINDAPNEISIDGNTISENSDGAVVGILSTEDVDTGDSHSYSVSDERFEVVNDGEGNIQLKLKDGQSLNYEKDASVEITVTSTDEGGLSTSQEFIVNVNDVNEFNLITGTENNDYIKGTSGDDKIEALDGNDSVYGEEGHDAIYGGGGNDVLAGQGGNDEVYGGAGDDRIYGGEGENV
ncbi:MAG: calcium-binding protein, partial [Gammaproteobacteria bacterium]